MDYEVISADTHLDIVWLPENLFVSEAPARLKERMPRVVETEAGRVWVGDGVQLGCVGAAALTGEYENYVPGRSHRLDRMADMGFFSDAERGLYRPGEPALRVKDQETDGVQGEVIYGVLGVTTGFSDAQGGMSDPEVVTATYDIYNQWVAEFCKAAPRRFRALACIPCHDPEVAAQRLRKAAEMGLKGAELSVSHTARPIYQREWDVLWAAAAECRMPISFHATGLPFRGPEGPVDQDTELVARGLYYTLFQLSGPEFLASIILSGACDRHPEFKFVLGEAGVGWIPYVLHRMDMEYEDRLFDLGLSMKPSDFWRRQGYTTFQDEPLRPELVRAVGEDNILWGSDYPHPEGTWPESQTLIEGCLGHLDERVRRKLVCENAGSLYGFFG